MFQVSSSPSDEMGLLVFLSIGGVGIFLLVIVLTVLAAKLASMIQTQDDMEGIMEAEDDDFSDHFDNIENEAAIFIIDEKDKPSEDIVFPIVSAEPIQQIAESDRNASDSMNRPNKQTIMDRILNRVKLLIFANKLMQSYK